MKKIILIVLLLLILVNGCSTKADISKSIETDCPRGEVNDPYPGKCGQYIDENNNDICDNSEPK